MSLDDTSFLLGLFTGMFVTVIVDVLLELAHRRLLRKLGLKP